MKLYNSIALQNICLSQRISQNKGTLKIKREQPNKKILFFTIQTSLGHFSRVKSFLEITAVTVRKQAQRTFWCVADDWKWKSFVKQFSLIESPSTAKNSFCEITLSIPHPYKDGGANKRCEKSNFFNTEEKFMVERQWKPKRNIARKRKMD